MPPDSDTLPSFHGSTLQPANAWSVPPSITTTKSFLFYHNLTTCNTKAFNENRPPYILDHSECDAARNRTIHSTERALTHTYHCMSSSTVKGGTYQRPWWYYSLVGMIFRPVKLWKPSIDTNASLRLSSGIIPQIIHLLNCTMKKYL